MRADRLIRQMTLQELEALGCLTPRDRAALEAWHQTDKAMPEALQQVLVEAMAQARHKLTRSKAH
jgi:hypothetical protein